MSNTRVIPWESVNPTPMARAALIQPEATDRFAPRPWLHWPPGSAFLLLACTAILFMAAFQSSVAVVRRDGLRGGIDQAVDQAVDAIPITLPAFVQPAARPVSEQHRHARHRRAAKLHLLLQQQGNSATTWSHDTASAAQN